MHDDSVRSFARQEWQVWWATHLRTSDFPTIEEVCRHEELRGYKVEVFQQVLTWLDEGSKAGQIRKTYLDSCKHTMGRLIYKAWSNEYKTRIDRSDERFWPEPLRKLFDNLYLSGLNDVIVANNKLQKSKATGPQVEVLRGFVDEVLPIALVAADLKSKVVKGREPPKEPSKPVNPNKIVRQCPCCFRGIAIGGDGTMVHHGYERPGNGSQTASCWGIDYPPLEVSTAGLDFMIANQAQHLKGQQEYLAHLATATSISVMVGMRVEKHKKGEKDFDWQLKLEKARVNDVIYRLENSLLVARYVRENWTPGRAQEIPIAFELRRQQEEEPSGPKL